MELTLALLQTACFVAAALALGLGKWQRGVVMLLAATALLSVGFGASTAGPRTLEWTHTFAGYAGIDLEPSAVHFPTGSVTRAGWLWPLPFAALAGLLGFALARVRPESRLADMGNGLALPLAFAWSCAAAWIGMQLLAAPSAVVQPYGADRFLWPAGLLLTLTLARRTTSFGVLFLLLSLGLVLQRLPLALFSKLATDHGLGTGLDVRTVTDFIHPFTKVQFQPRLLPGSPEQEHWLIWSEHVFAYPAFYLLGFTGIAFAAYMIRKHDRMAE